MTIWENMRICYLHSLKTHLVWRTLNAEDEVLEAAIQKLKKLIKGKQHEHFIPPSNYRRDRRDGRST